MTYVDTNVQSNPGRWGLRVVAEIEYDGGGWSFDTRIVWADAEGVLYTARDSGCSCPTPFERFSLIEELERVDLAALVREVAAEREPTTDQRSSFLAAVRGALLDPKSAAFDPEAYAKEQAELETKELIRERLREAATSLGYRGGLRQDLHDVVKQAHEERWSPGECMTLGLFFLHAGETAAAEAAQ